MTNLPVEGLPPNDTERLSVRVNGKYRAGIPRYGIARLTNSKNDKSLRVLVLGYDDDTAILMPYDIRERLGIENGTDLQFAVQKTGWLSKIFWLFGTPDPAVHVPTWLAFVSVCLGIFGVIIAMCS